MRVRATSMFRLATLIIAMLSVAAVAGPPQKSPTVMGTLGGNLTIPTAINDLGAVTGASSLSPRDNSTHAFLWSDGVMTDLGTLGGLNSRGSDVNELGQVVGWSRIAPGSGVTRAFIWDADHGMRSLGTLGGRSSQAEMINNLGQVVGVSQAFDGTRHGFIWDSVNGMQDLGLGNAILINDAGEVIIWDAASTPLNYYWREDLTGRVLIPDMHSVQGMSETGFFAGARRVGANIEPVRWSYAEGFTAIPEINDSRGFGRDVNDDGEVVGISESADGQHRAFFWSDTTGTVELETTGRASSAAGINNAGEIVGFDLGRSSTGTAMLWDRSGSGTELRGPLGGQALEIIESGTVRGQASGGVPRPFGMLWGVR